MAGREELVMTRAIEESIWSAGKIEDQLGREIQANASASIEGSETGEIDDLEASLTEYVEGLFRDLSILAERLGLPQFSREMLSELRAAKDSKSQISVMDVSQHGELLSRWLGKARRYHASLATLTRAGAVDGLQVFQTVLENTAIIISDGKIPPKNEAQVRNEVLRVLQYSFRDVLKEVSAAKIFKTYKPDIGIASLMAAAEYKFVDSKRALQKALDDIYADMRGYSGHYDWRTFYAVIYMTEPFIHQKDADAEFRYVNADTNWFPIVLNGTGNRTGKKP